jgi:hypothetical protein
MILYLYLFIIIILLTVIYNLYYEYFEDENIIFLNKNESLEIIKNSNDNYFERFSQIDLKVRNVANILEYKNLISDSTIDINLLNKSIIINAIKKITNIFNNYKIDGFDGFKANTIKWKIGLITEDKYESGYPHTRSGVILLPVNLIFTSHLLYVLIHEKVHIYQKIFIDDIKIYLSKNNFNLTSSQINNKIVRANPDIDTNIYSNKEGKLLYCIYNDNPKNLMDVTYYPINSAEYEHPFEFMAYSIENDIKNNIVI